jgi:prepilin-type processing-associated H-X9-DG protein
MYCLRCGAENPDGAQLCRSCNWVLTSTSPTGPLPDARTSGLAIASLVLAILGFVTFFLTALPAIILGIVGLFKIERSAGQLKGKGLAITGIVVPTIALPILLGILMPTLARTRQIAYRMVCGANMAGLGKAMIEYAGDNKDMYPTSDRWCDLLIKHEPNLTEKIFRCKGAKTGPCNYAMNKNIEKLGANAPPDMVLLFESKPGWNQSGGPELLTTENHRGDGCNILFGDCHAAFVRVKDINDLRWAADEKK